MPRKKDGSELISILGPCELLPSEERLAWVEGFEAAAGRIDNGITMRGKMCLKKCIIWALLHSSMIADAATL